MSGPENDHGLWGAALVSLITIIGWLSKWISNKASKDDLARVIDELRTQTSGLVKHFDDHIEQGREHRDRLEIKIDNMGRDVGATMVALSEIQGRLDEADRARR